MFGFKKNSIAVKLTLVMLGIVAVQGILLLGGVWISGVFTNLSNNDYSAFSKTVEINTKYVEDEMNLGLGNILSFAYDVIDQQEELVQQNGNLPLSNTSLLLEKITPTIIDMLNASFTTGAFVILDNDYGTNRYSSVYLKDTDPTNIAPTNGDISVFRGPKYVSRNFNLRLHELWANSLELTDEFYDVYTEPMRAAKENSDISKLGYWQFSQGLVDDDNKVATFSVPLIDKNGEAFGVIGIEVIEDSFYGILPDAELAGKGSLGYVFAIGDRDLENVMPILTQDAVNSEIVKYANQLELEVLNKDYNMYKIENLETEDQVACSIYKLSLYGEDSPFHDSELLLIGLIEEEELLAFTNSFIDTLAITFFATICLAIIMAFLVGEKFAMPITTLVKKVRTNDVDTVISLGKIGYWEIDELSGAIEELKQRSLNMGMKTNQILEMVNIPIGTFEYNKGSDFVTCSSAFLQLFNYAESDKMSSQVNSKEIFEKINAVKENPENDNENIFRINEQEDKWIKLVTVEDQNMVIGVAMDVSEEVIENKSLIFERDYDGLTNLLNRYGFRRNIEECFKKEDKSVAAFVLFDLDNLKYVNDAFGHDMGDQYIKSAAEALASVLSQNGTVGRMAGDEFYVFLYDFDTKKAIWDVLHQVYARLDSSRMTLPNGDMFKIRMSGGLAWYGDDSLELDELIRYADFAMYQGKHSIKGTVREFNKENFNNESFMLSGREELNRVLDNELVGYAYQPIITVQTGEIYGYEAFLRPQSELLNSPLKLIQIATEQSQLWKVEKITLFKLLDHYNKYREMFNDCKLFINSIPSELLREEEYEQLEEWYPEILKFIVLEVSESEKINDSVLKTKCALLEKWGGLIALDDYGSGYSGEISLLTLRPHIINIHKEIIADIETDVNRQLIVNKLLVYAKQKGILVLAEGVETYGQMEYLVNIGMDFLQGFYISRPQFQPNFDNTAIAKELEEIHKKML